MRFIEHGSISIKLTFTVLCLALLSSAAFGQAGADRDYEVRSIRSVPAAEPPEIDGVLDEPFWSAADWQGEFRQLKPTVGDPAQVETRIAVAHDSEHLYVAFRCFNDPQRPVYSRITRRDGNMDFDNAITLYLDTFHTRRDCYYFSTNSLGTQVDGRIGEDGSSNDKSWDCVWRVVSREDSLGWTAEFAIPVKEIRFSEKGDGTWGVNFRRNYPELFEVGFWNYNDRRWQVSRFGDITGLPKFKGRRSFWLYPYLVGLNSNQPSEGLRPFYSTGNSEMMAGADIRFNIGANAVGNFTVNPDFATVEGDQEVINLTRYATFYPEKRLYFLDRRELFNSMINVFYSRRIGDLDYGVKTAGRAGKSNFALLSARERASGDTPSSQTSVFRLQRDVLKSSNIGLIAVDRSFNGGYNRVLSGDASINLPHHIRFTSQVVGSIPSEGKITTSTVSRLRRFTEVHNVFFQYRTIDPGFKENVNQVGFIPDDNRRQALSGGNYTWWIRNDWIERMNFGGSAEAFWSYKGRLRDKSFGQNIGVTIKRKWQISFRNRIHTEYFEKRFENNSTTYDLGYNTQQASNFRLVYQQGRNFDLELDNWIIRPRFKLGDSFTFDYKLQYIRFRPDPDKRTSLLNVLTMDYNYNPDLFLRLFTQHHGRNDRFYLYGLLGWRFRPPFGALYIAYTADNYELWDDDLIPYSRENLRTLFVKLTLPVGR